MMMMMMIVHVLWRTFPTVSSPIRSCRFCGATILLFKFLPCHSVSFYYGPTKLVTLRQWTHQESERAFCFRPGITHQVSVEVVPTPLDARLCALCNKLALKKWRMYVLSDFTSLSMIVSHSHVNSVVTHLYSACLDSRNLYLTVTPH